MHVTVGTFYELADGAAYKPDRLILCLSQEACPVTVSSSSFPAAVKRSLLLNN